MLVTRVARRGYFQLERQGETSGELRRRDFEPTALDPPPGTDIWALLHKYVSVSPLQANFTDHHVIDDLGAQLNTAWGE